MFILNLENCYNIKYKFVILDVGSTSAKWYFVKDFGECMSLKSEGFNPTYQDDVPSGFFTRETKELLQNKNHVIYYGAGVSDEQAVEVIKKIFKPYNLEKIEIYSDSLAAARACCYDKPGLVSILGTGSNAIYFDGQNIKTCIPSMGYILGDHGSGSYIGKKLLEYYFTKQMPEEISGIFETNYDLNRSRVLNEVYSDSGSKYLASFAPFVNSIGQNAWMVEFIDKIFTEFIDIYLVNFIDDKNIPIHFVGSIAYNFRNLLSNIIRRKGLVLGKVLETPGPELVKYHIKSI